MAELVHHLPPGPGTTEAVIAYVDESARQGAEGVYYLVTAGVVVGAEPEEARRALMKLHPPRGRFHWRHEGQRGRLAMLAVMAELGHRCIHRLGLPVGSKRQEQARGRCLTALLANLSREGVDQVVIERRGEALDRADRQTVVEAKHAGLIPNDFTYGFKAPEVEPLLWLPDAIAGVMGLHIGGADSTYYDRLDLGTLLVVRRVP